MPVNDKAVQVLQTAKAPGELVRACQELAASADADDLAALVKYLRDPAFCDRLDPSPDAAPGPEDLMVARPLRSLAKNTAKPAKDAIVALMSEKGFLASPDRVDLLVIASGSIQPTPAKVAAFWKQLAVPDGIHTELAVQTAVENGSAPAIVFFEECLCNARFENGLRVAWMRRLVLERRSHEQIIALADRLVVTAPASKFPNSLKLSLVESICDYEDRWYAPHVRAISEPRKNAHKPGRDVLRKVIQFTLDKLSPPARLEAAARATLKELDALDQARVP